MKLENVQAGESYFYLGRGVDRIDKINFVYITINIVCDWESNDINLI